MCVCCNLQGSGMRAHLSIHHFNGKCLLESFFFHLQKRMNLRYIFIVCFSSHYFLFSMNEIAGNDEWFFFRILIACVD